MEASDRRKGANLCKQAPALASQCHRMGVWCSALRCACWHHAFLPGQTLDTILPIGPLDFFWRKKLWCQKREAHFRGKIISHKTSSGVIHLGNRSEINHSIVYWTLGAQSSWLCRPSELFTWLEATTWRDIQSLPGGFYHHYSAPFASFLPSYLYPLGCCRVVFCIEQKRSTDNTDRSALVLLAILFLAFDHKYMIMMMIVKSVWTHKCMNTCDLSVSSVFTFSDSWILRGTALCLSLMITS